MDLWHKPDLVRIVTTLTTPSASGSTLTTRVNGQCNGKVDSFLINTKVLTADICCVHLVRRWSCVTYSRDRRFQKCCRIRTNNWYHVRRFHRVSDKSNSGKDINASPIRKWPGVQVDRSLGSVDNLVRGQELRDASIWVRMVYSYIVI